MPKETSEEVSAIAAKYMNYQAADLMADFGEACIGGFLENPVKFLQTLTSDIRTLAASCLSQRSDADPDPIDCDKCGFTHLEGPCPGDND